MLNLSHHPRPPPIVLVLVLVLALVGGVGVRAEAPAAPALDVNAPQSPCIAALPRVRGQSRTTVESRCATNANANPNAANAGAPDAEESRRIVYEGDRITLAPHGHLQLRASLDDGRALDVTCVSAAEVVFTVGAGDAPWLQPDAGVTCAPWVKNERVCRAPSGDEVLVCGATARLEPGAGASANARETRSLGVPSWFVGDASESATSATSASATAGASASVDKSAPAFDPQHARRIAVAAFRADKLAPSFGDDVSDILAVEIEKFEGIDVVARSDLRGVIDQLAENQLLGCEDPSCFIDVTRLLPARRLLTGSVSRIGDSLYVQAALIDLQQARVVARAGAALGDSTADITAGMRTIALGLVTGDPTLLDDDTTVKGEVDADMLERVRIAQRPRGVALHAHAGAVFSAAFAFGAPTDPAYPGGTFKIAVDVPVVPWVSVTPIGGGHYYVGRFVSDARFVFGDNDAGFLDTRGVFVSDYGIFDAHAGLVVEVQPPTGLVRPYAFAGATVDVLVLDISDFVFVPEPGEPPLQPPFDEPITAAQSIAPGGGAVAGVGVDFNITEHAGISLELSAYAKAHGLERVQQSAGVVRRSPMPPLTGVHLVVGGFYEL